MSDSEPQRPSKRKVIGGDSRAYGQLLLVSPYDSVSQRQIAISKQFEPDPNEVDDAPYIPPSQSRSNSRPKDCDTQAQGDAQDQTEQNGGVSQSGGMTYTFVNYDPTKCDIDMDSSEDEDHVIERMRDYIDEIPPKAIDEDIIMDDGLGQQNAARTRASFDDKSVPNIDRQVVVRSSSLSPVNHPTPTKPHVPCDDKEPTTPLLTGPTPMKPVNDNQDPPPDLSPATKADLEKVTKDFGLVILETKAEVATMNKLLQLKLANGKDLKSGHKPGVRGSGSQNKNTGEDLPAQGDGDGGGGEGEAASEDYKLDIKRYSIKHLSAGHLQRQQDVRDHYFRILAGFKEDADPDEVKILPPPSTDELREFEQSQVGGPTLENFRLDFREGKDRSPWNRRAAKVFSRSYLKQKYIRQDVKDVEKSFISHLRTIREHYFHQVNPNVGPSPAQRDKKRIGRRRQRQKTTWKNRTTAATKHKDLVRYKDVLEVMGWDAMSGDESETGGSDTCYFVYPYEWRNPEVTPWIRVFDTIYEAAKRNSFGERGRGNKPRTRVPTTLHETRPGKVVKGLPKNFYNPAWLKKLNEEEIEDLIMQDPIDLTHTKAVLDFAAKSDRSNRQHAES